MLQLKLQNEQSKNKYYKELADLNQKLRLAKQKTIKKEKRDQIEELITDTATVLKKRLTKIILNNKEKVKLIDTYQKNMKTIDEAFNTIKEATGLTDIEEIQDTFIKGEEQNYGLLTYVDVLGQQIDSLEESNKQLEKKVISLKVVQILYRHKMHRNIAYLMPLLKMKKKEGKSKLLLMKRRSKLMISMFFYNKFNQRSFPF